MVDAKATPQNSYFHMSLLIALVVSGWFFCVVFTPTSESPNGYRGRGWFYLTSRINGLVYHSLHFA